MPGCYHGQLCTVYIGDRNVLGRSVVTLVVVVNTPLFTHAVGIRVNH